MPARLPEHHRYQADRRFHVAAGISCRTRYLPRKFDVATTSYRDFAATHGLTDATIVLMPGGLSGLGGTLCLGDDSSAVRPNCEQSVTS